jgi:hypothetical protein
MDSMPPTGRDVIGGIDTHQDLHTAAVVDAAGEVLATQTFATTRAGYRAMLAWFRSYGDLARVGVEATGTYGAGIARHLAAAGIPVLEVTGPDRAARRGRGKDDRLDAIAAAQAALTGQRVQVAKDRSGAIEALRVLRTTRKTAVRCRRATLQQLHNTIVAAPDELREQLRHLTRMRLLRTCAAWRPDLIAYRKPAICSDFHGGEWCGFRPSAAHRLHLPDEPGGDLGMGVVGTTLKDEVVRPVGPPGVRSQCLAEAVVPASRHGVQGLDDGLGQRLPEVQLCVSREVGHRDW